MEPEADVRDGSDEQAEDMSFDLTSTLAILVTGGLLLLGSLGWLFLGRPAARRQLAAVGQG